jgi:hypothetical protein
MLGTCTYQILGNNGEAVLRLLVPTEDGEKDNCT